MPHWWEGDPREQYWCEITDRDNIGADLKCPQVDGGGHRQWSYDLIKLIRPGEIIFHYSTVEGAFVGASVAGGPLVAAPIVWTSKAATGRRQRPSTARPGWQLPIHGFRSLARPVRLSEVNEADNAQWVRRWIERKKIEGRPYAPFQLYPGNLRAMQGYLAKMPLEFVQRWHQLELLANRLAALQEDVSAVVQPRPSESGEGIKSGFRPKAASDYRAEIKAGEQVRTRTHEQLVAQVGEIFLKAGAAVSNPHPIDLLLESPVRVIFEAKIVGARSPLFAIRQAVGQLLEYRHFFGPHDARLCILLDKQPDDLLVAYVEDVLKLHVGWLRDGQLRCGPKTTPVLAL